MTKVKMSKGVVTQDANGGSESAGQPEEAVQDEVFPNLIVDPKCPVSHPEVLLIPFKLLKECEQTLTNRSLALTSLFSLDVFQQRSPATSWRKLEFFEIFLEFLAKFLEFLKKYLEFF